MMCSGRCVGFYFLNFAGLAYLSYHSHRATALGSEAKESNTDTRPPIHLDGQSID